MNTGASAPPFGEGVPVVRSSLNTCEEQTTPHKEVSLLKNSLEELICGEEKMHQSFCPDAQINPKGGFEKPRTEQKEAKLKAKGGICRSCWPRATSPVSFLEQAFEILPRGPHQRFTVHPPEQTQAESPHAMPLFADRANNGSTHTLRLRMAF